jgi:hypothetical protein
VPDALTSTHSIAPVLLTLDSSPCWLAYSAARLRMRHTRHHPSLHGPLWLLGLANGVEIGRLMLY